MQGDINKIIIVKVKFILTFTIYMQAQSSVPQKTPESPLTEDSGVFVISRHNKLTVVKVSIETVLFKQFNVITLFNYIAVLHYKNNVGVLYG